METIKVGVLKNISKFLGLLSPPCRHSFLPLLHDFLHSASPFNWRMRLHLASQLSDLLLLPKRSSMCVTLFPLIMALFQDPVADVRHATFKGIASLIMLLDEMIHSPETTRRVLEEENDTIDMATTIAYSKECMVQVIHSINIFMSEDAYKKRLLWVELAKELLKHLPQRLCELFVVEGLVLLTSDPICNVRVAVSAALTGWESEFSCPTLAEITASSMDVFGFNGQFSTEVTNPYVWMYKREDIRECIKRLSGDDKDVYHHMVKIAHLFPHYTFQIIDCRGMKWAPGGPQPVKVIRTASFMYDDMDDSVGLDSEHIAVRDSKSSIDSSECFGNSHGNSSNSNNVDVLTDLAVVVPSGKTPNYYKKRTASFDVVIGGHSLAIGSPIDAAAAAAYLVLQRKATGSNVCNENAIPNECSEGNGSQTADDRLFWARVDDVESLDRYPNDTLLLPTLPSQYDDEDDELNNGDLKAEDVEENSEADGNDEEASPQDELEIEETSEESRDEHILEQNI